MPLTFFRQMGACVRRGHLVSIEGFPELPADYTAQAPQTDARFVFLAGERNRVLPSREPAAILRVSSRIRPGYHSLHVLPRYSHLDMFLGKDAARDVFPMLIGELDGRVRR